LGHIGAIAAVPSAQPIVANSSTGEVSSAGASMVREWPAEAAAEAAQRSAGDHCSRNIACSLCIARWCCIAKAKNVAYTWFANSWATNQRHDDDRALAHGTCCVAHFSNHGISSGNADTRGSSAKHRAACAACAGESRCFGSPEAGAEAP